MCVSPFANFICRGQFGQFLYLRAPPLANLCWDQVTHQIQVAEAKQPVTTFKFVAASEGSG